MRRRCYDSARRDFKNYGGRGIKVCARWKSFRNFLADMGHRPPNTTLDRIDNDKGYSPKNCRWATKEQQLSNMRCNVFVTISGVRKTSVQWAREYGINKQTFGNRVRAGWRGKSLLEPAA